MDTAAGETGRTVQFHAALDSEADTGSATAPSLRMVVCPASMLALVLKTRLLHVMLALVRVSTAMVP